MIVSYDTIMFKQPPFSIDADMLRLCTEIERLLGQIEGFAQPLPQLKLRKENRIRTVKDTLAIEGNTLTIQLKDISRDIFVTLKYQVDPTTGVLGRSAVIVNKTKEPVMVEQAAAGTWSLPDSTDYWLYYLTGRWAGEMNVQHEAVRPGARVRAELLHQISQRVRAARIADHDLVAALDREPRDLTTDVACTNESDGCHV